VPGSIQVPGQGQPIVLLADGQTAGGYPKDRDGDLGRSAAPGGDGAGSRSFALRRSRWRRPSRRRGREQATLRALIADIGPLAEFAGRLDLQAIYAANLVSGVVDARGEEPPSLVSALLMGEKLMVRRINLNADLGESFGAWQMGSDNELLRIVGAANIACGFHAGDPAGDAPYGPCRRWPPASASGRIRRFPTCRVSAGGRCSFRPPNWKRC
jgi:hypothetical protein